MTSVINLIRHYQKDIERCPENEERVLRCLSKLHQLGVTVQHLQDTGVGRTVNALRKEPGEVGTAARALVAKWKHMVASAEESSEEEENYRNSERDSAEDSDHNVQQSRQYESDHETEEYNVKNYHNFNGESGSPSKRRLSDEEYNNSRKRGRYENSTDNSENEEKVNSEKFKVKEDKSESEYHSKHYNENLSDSSEEEQQRLTIKEDTQSENEQDISKSKSSKYLSREHKDKGSKSGHSNKHEFETQYRSDKDSKKQSSKDEKDKKENDSRHSGDHKAKRSEKQEKKRDKIEISEKSSKSDESSKSSDRHKSSEKSEKSSSKDKHRSSSEKHKSSKHKDKYKDEKSSKHKEKDREQKSSGSSYHREHSLEKYSDKNKHEKQDKVHHNGRSPGNKAMENHKNCEVVSKSKHSEQSSSYSHKSKSERSSSESKNKSESVVKEIEEKKIDKTGSASSKHKSSSSHKSSSKSKDEMPKKKNKLSDTVTSDDGIGCESGASFAEALGMVSPVKAKKKKEVESTSSNSAASSNNKASTSNGSFTVPASLLAPTTKLEPLQPLEISALPEISPNYKPRPPPKLLPQINEDDALSYVMSTKNQRTKVFSGNKTYGKVLTLYELCVNVLQQHIDALEYTGGVPYEILKPVVDKANPDQLFSLEHYNPYLMEDTNHLWKLHCEKSFRGQKRREMETWREMYLRCQEEQEARLKSLTANIKRSQDAKNAPTKQTKMAYVDTVVKPPRNIAKKQAIYGTARAAVTSPAARVASLSTSGVVKAGTLPSRPSPMAHAHTSAPAKQTRAPLMQKALQLMRGRRR